MLAVAGLRVVPRADPVLEGVGFQVIRGDLLPVVVDYVVVEFLEGVCWERAGDIKVVMIRAFEVGGSRRGVILCPWSQIHL